MINFSTGFPAKASERLQNEHVIWLTTVDRSGYPQTRPVWFQWDGETILVFSQPGAAKVRHIRRNPAVSINLNSDFFADNVTVLLGQAKILADWPDGPRVEDYVEKYHKGMKAIEFTPESFRGEYSTALEILPSRVRGF